MSRDVAVLRLYHEVRRHDVETRYIAPDRRKCEGAKCEGAMFTLHPSA
ncbi:MAG TPA: hypothetical protein V6D09_03325 [Leptolyngbyaceae cyanobacterium]